MDLFIFSRISLRSAEKLTSNLNARFPPISESNVTSEGTSQKNVSQSTLDAHETSFDSHAASMFNEEITYTKSLHSARFVLMPADVIRSFAALFGSYF